MTSDVNPDENAVPFARRNLVRVDPDGRIDSGDGCRRVLSCGGSGKRGPNVRELLIELGSSDTAKLFSFATVARAEGFHDLNATVMTLQVNGDLRRME
jgi:hypothetical protein